MRSLVDVVLRRSIVAALGLLSLASGCGDSSQVAFVSNPTLPEQVERADSGQAVLAGDAARAELLLGIAHRGVRRIDVWGRTQVGSEEVPTHLAFLERITTDGHGKFAIEPIESLTPGQTDWDAFDLLQRVREGFVFRYRDFAVRDRALFERNWRWTKIPGEHRVAGRLCERVRVERARTPAVAYEVSIDAETGIVLAYQEFDAEGSAVCALEYTTFELAPDLSGAVWHRPSNEELALDLGRDLASQVEVAALRPRLLPEGFELRGASTIEDGEGRRWLKLTYLDGVEPLFFLQALPAGGEAVRTAAPAGAPEPDTIAVYSLGRATVLQGSVRGQRLMVVGKVGEAELLDLIESALP